mmetsp:Transcript_72013/g.154117  ORF Transcript_72013/g.154117 Transcript_72013/m.154117 type:complete len:472 (-) Transcript_72013:138-1553(-)
MPRRPPSSQLQVKLPCAHAVDNVTAFAACEAAARKRGFCVAVRSRRSLLLMPGPRRSMTSCLSPSTQTDPSPRTSSRAGRGITAELVFDDESESLAISVDASCVKSGEAFVSALGRELEGLDCGERLASPSASPSASPHSEWGEEHIDSPSRFKIEAQAYYFYSAILCNTRHAPGAAAADFVRSFTKSCQDQSYDAAALSEGLPIAECSAALRWLSLLLEEHLGSARPAPEDLAPLLRTSVERCLFGRVGSTLWHLYRRGYAGEDERYVKKLRALGACRDDVLLEALGVRSEFRGTVSAKASAAEGLDADMVHLAFASKDDAQSEISAESQWTRSTAAESEDGMLSRLESHPYGRAAAALADVEVALSSGRGASPREAVEILADAQLEVKTCALEASGGRAELYSMDDLMPVFVFVLARAKLAHPFALAALLGASLSQDERLESEGRAVLLLESAARYIEQEWDLGELPPQ